MAQPTQLWVLWNKRRLGKLLLQVVGDVRGVSDPVPVMLKTRKFAGGIELPNAPRSLRKWDLLDLMGQALPMEDASDLVAIRGDLELKERDHGLFRGAFSVG